MKKINRLTSKNIVHQASEYVINQMTYHWDSNLHFHNLEHTRQVVRASKKISKIHRLIPSEIEIIELAAWFHDLGYIISADGHEQESAKMANEALHGMAYPERLIKKVVQNILATKFPQRPVNLLEKIICDADLHHLSTSSFPSMSENLRKEKASFGLNYSRSKWTEMNREFFEIHQYWTTYGRDILTPAKDLNYLKFLA